MFRKALRFFIWGIVIFSLVMVTTVDDTLWAKKKKTPLNQGTDAKLRVEWYQRHLQMNEMSTFKNLEWAFIGPVWMSGRITDIEALPGKPYTYYVAAASGGVWKTENEGTTWEPIFQHGLSTSIGDIALAPSNLQIIWVGTGENNSSRSSYSGAGVYKSEDGGKTWKHMGLWDTHHTGRIIVHPENPDVVYVAAVGHLYSFNEERGVFKTADGGKTWEKILYINHKTGVIDLVMDPSDTNILYAAAWERLRKAWNMWEDGPGSAIYKTQDGGKTWEKLTNGLPTERKMGRIGLAVAHSNPNVIYALVDNQAAEREPKPGELDSYGFPAKKIIKGAELYRSDDKGKTWKKINQHNIKYLYFEYGYYFGEVRVDPCNEDIVYLLGISLRKSVDGGKTFRALYYKDFHADHQAFWIDPGSPNHLIDGNDGGINISYDGGKTWKDLDNLPVVQFYNVYVDMETPFNVYGSVQDNGSFKGPVTHNPADDPAYDWKRIPGGEASYIEVDPTDANILYSEGSFGGLMRSNLEENSSKPIKPKAEKGEPRLRCTWLTPFIISPHNPFTLYFGSQYLYCSVDRGEHWQRISPDLTTNPKEEQGDVPYGAISTISESPLMPGLIYVGTDDGNVQVTKNGGVSWQKINAGFFPAKKWVSRIVASKFDKGTVYLSFNGYRDDDFQTYIYKSSDYGKTWEDISSNLPCGPVNVIWEDPQNKNVFYAGTDLGVYISLDRGKEWYSLLANMPTTFVHDLVVHPRDNILVAATHGRGFYTMDVSAIQTYASDEKIQAKDLHIFEISTVTLPRSWWQPRKPAQITYTLKKAQEVKVTVLDAKDNVIKSFKAEGAVGFNRITWNLTTDSRDRRKYFAPKGIYTIQINAGGIVEKQKVELK
ncbi:MAG: hypothetical protein GTO45_34290 [Candidatus Aminicenantes bacterium]|nr:hypothetical protein [Candidatus Aminicenantes bacterium]NIM83778.1 hypothetical protein [Candidatus Aminicenantes bacterium]NIN23238.1 hypothetical protein [Candidatus Aminicenantes bacterium]NIN46932.1 hypothetical protein [Candidatus Aminicenantes bacterium]NIN89854.1 hypothetical protein [Candidatus Aminicenantes bacterium]